MLLSEVTGEIALFAAVGGLLFALDDLLVDLIYFAARGGARWPSTAAIRAPSPTRSPRPSAPAASPC